MAKLIVNPTSPSRREVALSRSLVSIGRDPSNDVVLPDAMVSRRHAVIEYRGSQYYLRDCNSSNGSLINGDRVSERGLRDGDLVAIGTARLLFRDDLVAEDAAGKVIHHPSAPRQQCPSCGQDYRKGDVFCRYCGGSLAPVGPARTICTACGTAVPLPARFCTACGTRLEGASAEGEEPGPESGDRPGVEAHGPRAVEGQVQGPEPSLPAFHLASTADDVPVPARRGPAAGAAPSPVPVTPAPEPAPPAPAPVPPPLVQPPRATAAPAPASRAPASAPEAARPERPAPEGPAPEADAPTSKAPAVPGGALRRLAAFALDALVVGAGQALLALPAALYWMGRARRAAGPPADVAFLPIFLSVALLVLAAVLGAVYHVYFVGVKAATPGKRMLGLVVQGLDGRQPIGPGRGALRVVGYAVSGIVLGIGFLMIAFGGGGLHDQIAGTRVVRRKGD